MRGVELQRPDMRMPGTSCGAHVTVPESWRLPLRIPPVNRRLLIPAVTVVTAVLLPAAARAAVPVPATAGAVAGVWVTPNEKSHVRIYRGADGKYHGRIVWLKQPDYPQNFKVKRLAGKPKVDRHNPDKGLRSRPVLGLDVLTGFQYLPAEHAWGKGKCYDPEKGKTYNCRMWLQDGGHKLKLRGYVWIFHRTETWIRYTAPPATGTSAHSLP